VDPYGGMVARGQDGPEGAMALAGCNRALLARPCIVAWGHAGSGGQTRCYCTPCHSHADLYRDHCGLALVDPRHGGQAFDGAGPGECRRGHGLRAVAWDGQGNPALAGCGVDPEGAQGRLDASMARLSVSIWASSKSINLRAFCGT